jgi:hypothetical protein
MIDGRATPCILHQMRLADTRRCMTRTIVAQFVGAKKTFWISFSAACQFTGTLVNLLLEPAAVRRRGSRSQPRD